MVLLTPEWDILCVCQISVCLFWAYRNPSGFGIQGELDLQYSFFA